jgi:hypothetical protein
MKLDISVGIVISCRLEGLGSIPDSAIFFSSPQASYLMGKGDSLPGVKRQGSEADHSPPSSAEVKKVRAILPFRRVSSWRSAEPIKRRGIFIFYAAIYSVRS